MFGIFGFLGFIFILIILIVFIVLAFLGNIVRSIFGLGKRAPKHFYGDKTSSTHTENSYTSTQSTKDSSSNAKRKIFSDDEGEYVEFEEVQ